MNAILCFGLQQEAEPFIKSLNAKQVFQKKSIKLYKSNTTYVLISGIGALNMAFTMGWMCSKEISDYVFWNIGCAGKAKDLNTWFRIIKVNSHHHNHSFIPEIFTKTDLPFCNLISKTDFANKTELSLVSNTCVDYEGYAFAKATQNFVSTSQIQLLKWISDSGDKDFYKNKSWQNLYQEKTELILNQIKLETEIILTQKNKTEFQYSNLINKVLFYTKLSFTQQEQLIKAFNYSSNFLSEKELEIVIDKLYLGVNKAQTKSVFNNLLSAIYSV